MKNKKLIILNIIFSILIIILICLFIKDKNTSTSLNIVRTIILILGVVYNYKFYKKIINEN
ncbi:MAG: hypothetical protein Q4B36_07505 [Tissierellia bacterium]|nr:hypothetical protein [Tissierellia bacterium]